VQRRVGHVAALSPADLITYHADRMMRIVMRVSAQASISAVQMSASSLKYVTRVFMALRLTYVSVDLGHELA
jgi:hypothetical protein